MNSSQDGGDPTIKDSKSRASSLTKQDSLNDTQKRAFYIEQKSKILQNLIKQTEPILIELSNRIKWFEAISELNEEERIQLIVTLSDNPQRTLE